MRTIILIALSTLAFLSVSAKDNTLLFIENKGQVTDQHFQPRSDIRFVLHSGNVNIFVGTAALHYQLARPGKDSTAATEMYRLDVTLAGANKHAVVIKENAQPYFENYYGGHAGENGATAHSYQKITYREIYPHIDWVLYTNNGQLEHEFIVRPNGDPSDIKIQYSGATSLTINNDGSLIATTPLGTITEQAPVSFQQDGKAIQTAFVINNNVLSFNIAPYTGTLTIDPVLDWSTYYGGTEADVIDGVTHDSTGNIYTAGWTVSSGNIATVGSHQWQLPSVYNSGFITKFNSSGIRQWATYYGGNGNTKMFGIVSDQDGHIYIAGITASSINIATPGSHQPAISGGDDAFLVKFDTNGSRLWGTYYGGNGTEGFPSLAYDGNGHLYIAGTTTSTNNLITTGCYASTPSSAFFAKFDTVGLRQWGSYHDASTQVCAVAANDSAVYIAGTTSNLSFATTGAHQPVFGGSSHDGFVSRFTPQGLEVWATYYGGGNLDETFGLAVDKASNVYIAGYTDSYDDIATTGSHQPLLSGGSNDSYLAKFNSQGVRLWGTYYGGTGHESSGYPSNGCISFDDSANVFLAGITSSTSGIATPGSPQTTFGGSQDAFLVKFDSTGVRKWATYYGGGIYENNIDCEYAGGGAVYLTGATPSISNIATPGSHQTAFGGTGDGFIAKYLSCDTILPITAIISGNTDLCEGDTATYSIPPVPGATTYTWIVPFGWQGYSDSNVITVVANYTDVIQVIASNGCYSAQQSQLVNVPVPAAIITPLGSLSFCPGDSVRLDAIFPITVSLQWLHNGNIIPGAVNDGYTATASGIYSVMVSENNCVDTIDPQVVNVFPLPVPVISQNVNTLTTANTFTTYQWYYNNTAINNATSQQYTALQDGDYYVIVTDVNGCTDTSNTISVLVTGIKNKASQNHTITLYPNPNDGTFTIRGATNAGNIIGIQVINLLGSVVYASEEPQQSNNINKQVTLPSHLSAGTYFLKLQTNEGQQVLRFVKE